MAYADRTSETLATVNAVHETSWNDTGREFMYRYSVNKNGTFRCRAIYTGLPTGCIGSGGKSFKTEAERDFATEASVAKLVAKDASWTRCEFPAGTTLDEYNAATAR